jgi:hypothetical protein
MAIGIHITLTKFLKFFLLFNFLGYTCVKSLSFFVQLACTDFMLQQITVKLISETHNQLDNENVQFRIYLPEFSSTIDKNNDDSINKVGRFQLNFKEIIGKPTNEEIDIKVRNVSDKLFRINR